MKFFGEPPSGGVAEGMLMAGECCVRAAEVTLPANLPLVTVTAVKFFSRPTSVAVSQGTLP